MRSLEEAANPSVIFFLDECCLSFILVRLTVLAYQELDNILAKYSAVETLPSCRNSCRVDSLLASACCMNNISAMTPHQGRPRTFCLC